MEENALMTVPSGEINGFTEALKMLQNIFQEIIILLELPLVRSGNNYCYAEIWFQLLKKNYSATIFATT